VANKKALMVLCELPILLKSTTIILKINNNKKDIALSENLMRELTTIAMADFTRKTLPTGNFWLIFVLNNVAFIIS